MSLLAVLALAVAIVTEVAATVSLRLAGSGSSWWWVAVVAGYGIAFSSLALTLEQGMPLGVAYGIWAAIGVALTALLGRVLFAEPLTWLTALGLVLIMGGVLLIATGPAH